MKETNKILALYILIILVVALSGCSVEKKNQKAVDRVKADVNLLNDVGRTWLELNPCTNDSVTITTTDTLTNVDTIVQIDVQTRQDTVFITNNRDIVKTVRIRDTVKIVVADRQKERLLEKDVQLATQRMIQAQAETIKAKDKYEAERKRKNLYFWILIAIAGLSAIGVVLKLRKGKAG